VYIKNNKNVARKIKDFLKENGNEFNTYDNSHQIDYSETKHVLKNGLYYQLILSKIAFKFNLNTIILVTGIAKPGQLCAIIGSR